MNIKIRRSVFETNSSSVHSMIITKEETNPMNQIIQFNIGNFGWEETEYHHPDDKASYFYTAACAIKGYDVKDEIKALLDPYGVRCTFEKPVFRKSSYYPDTWYLSNGGIDHDYECTEFVNAMFNNSDMLVRFLLNDDSFVHTGNDNSEMEWFDVVHNTEYPHDEFVKGN